MKSARTEKVYYAIGEVADMFQVNTSLIRFWEKEFDVLRPRKNKKGNRLFTEKDVRYLHMIYHLVKVKGYTLQGARDAIKEQSDALEIKIRLIETLAQTKQFLQQLDAALAEKLKKA
ncbi:MAG: MerR family transcriptional regulator [Bacteroidetes bacterium]|nr:MerR family transcriptional regulator [Bacteroidota bacterium]